MTSKHYEWRIGDSLPELGDHSLAKHEIFERYVRIYIERLTRNPSQDMLNLTLVDGFCGGGIYARGQTKEEGSPLRLLRAVEEADQRYGDDHFVADQDGGIHRAEEIGGRARAPSLESL